jgi:hypothetical protein
MWKGTLKCHWEHVQWAGPPSSCFLCLFVRSFIAFDTDMSWNPAYIELRIHAAVYNAGHLVVEGVDEVVTNMGLSNIRLPTLHTSTETLR